MTHDVVPTPSVVPLTPPVEMTDYLILVNTENAVLSLKTRVNQAFTLEKDVPRFLNDDEREALWQGYRALCDCLGMVMDRE